MNASIIRPETQEEWVNRVEGPRGLVPDLDMQLALGGLASKVPGLVSKAVPKFSSLSQALGEAGAVFPEGAPIPKDRNLAKELGSLLTDSQLKYRRNEALSNWHAENQDWPRVLADKWAMLMHQGGN